MIERIAGDLTGIALSQLRTVDIRSIIKASLQTYFWLRIACDLTATALSHLTTVEIDFSHMKRLFSDLPLVAHRLRPHRDYIITIHNCRN